MSDSEGRATVVALVGHRGSGKTTLAEHLLAAGRAVRQPGSIEQGTTLLDHHPDERRRKLSLQLGFGWIEVGDRVLQLIDVPGSPAARFERRLAIEMSDLVVVVVDGSERLAADVAGSLQEAAAAGVPTIVFVNKLDRARGSMDALVAEMVETSSRPLVAVEAVLQRADGVIGVADLVSRELALLETVLELEEPGAAFVRPWEILTEAVALTDDALLEEYLEYLELPPDEVRQGLRTAVCGARLVPVVHGAALRSFGIDRLLDLLTDCSPDVDRRRRPLAHECDGTPVPVAADGGFVAQLLATQLDGDGEPFQVFRVWSGEAPVNRPWVHGDTGRQRKVRRLYRMRGRRRAAAKKATRAGSLVATWDLLPGRPGDTFTSGERLVIVPPEAPPRMMAYALHPATERDRASLRGALEHLLAMDGGLELHTDDTTGELLLGGASEAHLDLAIARLGWLGVQVSGALPPIPYREVPANSVRNVEGIHKLEDGDGLPVEYGACNVDVEPRPDEAIDFEDAFPDADELPRRFRPAIDQGVRKALEHGPTAGYPVLGAHVRLTGGDYDILQSTEDHFRIAGEIAARRALKEAGTRLLEPWWQVDVYAPSDDIGAVISEVAQRRGRVVGLEVLGGETRVCVQVPYRELRTFGPSLESVSGGRGRFFGEASHYEVAPDHLVDEAIRSSPFRHAS